MNGALVTTCFLISIHSSEEFQSPQLQQETAALQRPSMLDQFRSYIGGGRVDSELVYAATILITREGDWKRVLAELETNPDAEVNCVRILGRMAAHHAQMRDLIDLHIRGEYRGSMALPADPKPRPPAEYIPALLDRARQADNWKLDHYVIALARARDPRTRDFLSQTLAAHERSPSVRFHAAVGLANLGDPAGVEWLIRHADTSNEHVHNAWPRSFCSTRLDASCERALQALSGRFSEETCGCSRGGAYWLNWWEEHGRKQPLRRFVGLAER